MSSMKMFSNYLVLLLVVIFFSHESKSLECGGKIKERFGSIHSPSFPTLLPSNVNCTWTIIGSNVNDVIQIEINALDLNDTESDDCSITYLQIGDYGQAGLQFCNDQRPPVDLLSTTNQVEITLVTSASSHNNSKGFSLNFKILDKGNTTTTVTPVTTVIPTTCGGNLTYNTGSINSPNYPNAYSSDLRCIWTISGKNVNDYIELEFDVIDIEDVSKDCSNNYISFGDLNNEKSLPRYCNQNRPQKLEFSSHTQHVVIRFVTYSKQHNSMGFLANYRIYAGAMTTGRIVTTPRWTTEQHHDKSTSTPSHVARNVVLSIICIVFVCLLAYDLCRCRYGRGVCYQLFYNTKTKRKQRIYTEL